MRIIHYLTDAGKDLYQDWLDGLRDMRARVAIQRRVDRLAIGTFGDHRFCRAGVCELRIDVGAGYRVYSPKPAKPWCCCCAAATSAPRMPTSIAPWIAGRTISGDYHEQETLS